MPISRENYRKILVATAERILELSRDFDSFANTTPAAMTEALLEVWKLAPVLAQHFKLTAQRSD